ncbi:DUF2971 domain-containing protein [Proteus vulgaris]|uniref:DUF2971 domain-containing protein n=1 Tax=Proteus vulgaris TaxID=585 RepID=UPI002889AE46|nr:DUF2971 domain-containing protein [Proteus vulgaris]
MSLLYKYTTTENCLHILDNYSFKWSNISEFNDPFEGLCLNPTDIHSAAREIAITISINNPMLQDNKFQQLIDSNPQHSSIRFISSLRDKIHYLHNKFMKDPTIPCYYDIERDIYNFLISNKKIFNQFYKDQSNPNLLSEASKRTFHTTGVLCLSKAKNNTLMWSHYAKDHTGVMFELDKRFFSFKNEVAISDITYQNNVPECNYDDLLGINRNLFKKQNDNLFKIISSTKSLSWAYEKEVRLLRLIHNEQRLHPLPIKSFKAIYLGCKIKECDKNKIIDKARKSLPDLSIYQTEIDNKTYDLRFFKLADY